MSENYPMGADNDKSAPWNRERNPLRLVDVTVSVTLSKTVTVAVDDYTEEDGKIDYSTCNLEKAVRGQITLPQDAYNYVFPSVKLPDVIKDLKNWNEDEMEVVFDDFISK